MKTQLTAVLIALMTHSASASCYMVYDRSDRLVFRSFSTPVDLSQPIRNQVQRIWPGGGLIIAPDAAACTEVDARLQIRQGGTSANAQDIAANLSVRGVEANAYATESMSRPEAGEDVNVRSYTKQNGTMAPAYTRPASGSRGGGRSRYHVWAE